MYDITCIPMFGSTINDICVLTAVLFAVIGIIIVEYSPW